MKEPGGTGKSSVRRGYRVSARAKLPPESPTMTMSADDIGQLMLVCKSVDQCCRKGARSRTMEAATQAVSYSMEKLSWMLQNAFVYITCGNF
jgi:hypothetical protein